MRQIDKMPRKGTKIQFDSKGMFPNCDNRKYIVIGHEHDILIIKDIKTGTQTRVIANFKSGYNEYLYFT